MRRFKKLFVTILVVATILGTASAFTSAASLLDVEGTKYAGSVGKLVGIGVLTGYPDGTFKPAATVTRAQMAAILVRSLGLDDAAKLAKGATPFADVPATHWASGYVNVAFNKGIVTGVSETKFNPDDTVTGAQAITMLVRATGHAGEVTGAWPAGYIEVATKLGLIANVDFAASAPATRGDIAIMTDTAVYTVTNPTSGESLAWSVFKAPSAKPDTTAPVITLTSPAAGKVSATSATVSGSVSEAATLKVNGTAVTLGAGNTFSTSVSLAMGDNTITVEATDKYGNAAAPVSVVVNRYGAAASLALTPSTATVAVGGTASFAAAVKDEAGQALTDTVTYAADKGTIAADGTYTAPTTPGTATITATSGSLSATATVTVNAGALATVTVTPATASLATGQQQAFAAKGYDANGNEVAITPAWSVDNNGVISAAGTFAGASGSYTVTATSGTVSGTATVKVSGAATKVVTTASSTSIKANGTSTSVITATLQDANGNTAIGDSSSKVTFTKVGPGGFGTQATTVTVSAGVASITLTSTTNTGIARVTATSNLPGVTGSYVDVTLATPTITQVKTSVNMAQVSADNTTRATISAKLADENGVTVASGTNVVTFKVSSTDYFKVVTADGDASTDGYQVTAAGGVATFQVESRPTPGSITVTASATGLTSDAGVTVNSVQTGPSTKLVIVGPLTDTKVYTGVDTTKMQKVVVQVQDYNGNLVTANNTASVTLVATEKGTSNPSVTITGGATQTVTAGKFTYYIQDTEAEAVEYTATSGGLTSASKVTGTFTTGDPSQVKVTSTTPGTVSADGTSTATVTASILDVYGNLVSTATNLVTFSRTGGTNTTLPSTLAVNAVGGKATISVTSKTTPGGPDTFDATAKASDGTNDLTNAAEVNAVGTNQVATALFGMPNNLVITGGGATAGTAKTVTVAVKDYAGNTITSNNSAVITLTVDGSATVASNPVTAVNGVATFSVTDNVAETVNLKADGLGLPQATGVTLVVGPSTLSSVVLKAARSSIAADGSMDVITAEGHDAYGNVITPPEVITLTYSPTSTYGTLVGNANVDTSASGLFTSNTTPGSITISGTATTAGVTVSPVTITTYVPVTAYSLRFQTMPTPKAGETKSVKVEVLDYNGNVLTSNTGMSIALEQNSGGKAVFATPVTTLAGVAGFNVRDIKAETLTLTAKATGLVSATGSLVVAPAAADHTVISASPAWIANDGIAQSVISVKVLDAFDNTQTSANGTVTLANNLTTSGTLSGTSATITNGVNSNTIILTSKSGAGSAGAPVISQSAISGITLATPAANQNATVSVGTAASKYLVTLSPSTVTVGGSVTVSAQLADASNNPVATAGKTVTWGGAGAGSFGSATSTTDSNGVATVTYTAGSAPATPTLTATDTDTYTGSAGLTVNAGSASGFTVTMAAGPYTVGGTKVATAQLKDSLGNNVSQSGVVITWADTGTGAYAGEFSAATSTTDGTGAATVTVTLNTTAGRTHIISGTATGLTPTAAGSITTVAGAPATIAITPTGATSVTAGGTQAVAATVRDAYGNLVADGTTVNFAATAATDFTVSAASATTTAGVATVNAQAAATITGTNTATVTATVGVLNANTGLLTNVAGAAHHFAAALAVAGSKTAGAAFEVTFTAQDANNNTVTSYTGAKTISFTSAATASPNVTAPTIPASQSVTFTAGVGTTAGGTFILTNAGETPTISGSAAGVTAGATTAITVNPATAATFTVVAPGTATAGSSFAITSITAKDAYGNTATGYTGAKTIAYSGPANSPKGTAPSYTTAVTFAAGVATTTLTTTLTNAESVAIGAADGGVTGTSGTVVVSPGAVNDVESTFSPTTANAPVGTGVAVTVTLKDAEQNPVPNVAITLAATGATGGGVGAVTTQPGSTNASGQAIGIVRATAGASTDTVTFSATAPAGLTDTIVITIP